MELKKFNKISIYDHQHSLEEHMLIDSVLAELCNDDELIIRFWVSEGVVFGKLDTTLNDFEKGLMYLNHQNIKTAVRRSGGLAVFLDDNTLNLSIIFAKDTSSLDLHEAYKKTVSLLSEFIGRYNVTLQNKEVENSYCPGLYDCVINDYKFSGIAQFQTKKRVVVMLNIVVNGDQKKRLEHIKNFYEISNTKKNKKFPTIDVDSMKTLSELSNLDLSPVNLIDDFKLFLQQNNKSIFSLKKIHFEE